MRSRNRSLDEPVNPPYATDKLCLSVRLRCYKSRRHAATTALARIRVSSDHHPSSLDKVNRARAPKASAYMRDANEPDRTEQEFQKDGTIEAKGSRRNNLNASWFRCPDSLDPPQLRSFKLIVSGRVIAPPLLAGC